MSFAPLILSSDIPHVSFVLQDCINSENSKLMIQPKSKLATLACLVLLAGYAFAADRSSFSNNERFRNRTIENQSNPIATLNGQPITMDDLDPRLREVVGRLDIEIAAARKEILNQEIESYLFDAEAKRRRIPFERLMNLEVAQKVANPTGEEVQAIYDANRTQFGTADLDKARPQIVAYLRREALQKLTSDFAARLRKRFVVVMGNDINSPTLSSNSTLATVAGRAITAGPIIQRLKPVIYDMRLRVFEVIKKAVDQYIYDLLVLDEARRRSVAPDVVIRKEISDKYRPPTEDEITKYYEDNKARINGDLATMHGAIARYLEDDQRSKLENSLGDRLRKSAKISILLTEPEPPVLAISTDDDPSRGPANAPVTVVVFSDFQCPNCGLNYPVIEEVIKSYSNSVRLVVRDFPLEMHENARKAAEAANAAYAQGKFFEYEALLYKNQSALDTASLKKYATEIGLNRARFDAALDGGIYAAEVEHDIADGQSYGILGTPTVFVNGVRVNVLSAETLRAAIDKALAQKKPAANSPGGTTK